MALLMAFHTYVAQAGNKVGDIKRSNLVGTARLKSSLSGRGAVIFGVILVGFNLIYWTVAMVKYYAEV